MTQARVEPGAPPRAVFAWWGWRLSCRCSLPQKRRSRTRKSACATEDQNHRDTCFITCKTMKPHHLSRFTEVVKWELLGGKLSQSNRYRLCSWRGPSPAKHRAWLLGISSLGPHG